MKKTVFLMGFFLIAFIHPLSLPAGTLSLDYSTYLGGTGGGYSQALEVDSAGCAYVSGTTSSGDFPTVNPYQSSHSSPGSINIAFVTKFSSEGSSLVYSTYLGDWG